jgi:CheY-like chemotaxis protein
MTFLITDGVLPSNEGRGYVLRRILRRASRYAKLIGITKPILYKLTGAVVDEMREAYPELADSRDHVAKVVLLEEERFAATLDSGLALLNESVAKLKTSGQVMIPGDVLFSLYDTFGFPLDLVADMARDMHLELDEDGYRRAMQEQREKARAAWAGSGEKKVKPIYKEISSGIRKTVFTGYGALEGTGEVVAIISGDRKVSEVKEGDEAEIILDQTTFYAESGGQVGDRGELLGEAAKFSVTDTVKPVEGVFIHKGRVKKGGFKVGDAVLAKVDAAERQDTVRHHTATHILHATLRSVLGEHVKQAGSLVAPDRCRFDFTHYTALSEREKERIEELVNERIIDYHMPEIDGLQLAGLVKADPSLSGLRLIMLSSVGIRGDGRKARETGIAGYLTKPVRREVLHETIAAVMGIRDPAAEGTLVTSHNVDGRQKKIDGRILLVEDNLVNQEVALGMLSVFGCQADVVGNGQAAIDAIAAQEYDLVLMDCQMPVMDGYTATRALRSREKESGGGHLPVVALTANALQGDSDACLAAGMDDYLSKPFTIQSLGDMLRKWISAGEAPAPSGGEKAPADGAAASRDSIDLTVLDGIRALEETGNQGLLERIIGLYLSESSTQMAGVRSAAEEGQMEALLRAVHSLKSSSANVGAIGFSELCRKIEGSVRAGEPIAVGDPLLSNLEGEYWSVQEALTTILKGASA